jgi:hypothetical protein
LFLEILQKKGTMETELTELLLSCGIEEKQIEKKSIEPTKVKKARPAVKYVHLGGKTKEEKLYYVISLLRTAYEDSYLLGLKNSDLIEIKYSRPYANSTGGPIFYVGKKGIKTAPNDEACGRETFRELNARFPIQALKHSLASLREEFSAISNIAA